MEMDYTAIKNDIENRIKEKFEPIQKEINNINTMECGGSGLLSTNNTSILPLDKLCINLNLTYDVPNWNVVIENKGKLWMWYTLGVGYTLKGAYYHLEDADKDRQVSNTCQLIPIYPNKKDKLDLTGSVEFHMKETIDSIFDKLKNVEIEINKYIEERYPKLRIRTTTSWFGRKQINSSNRLVLYYRYNQGNPEQYREFFMDQWIKYQIEYYSLYLDALKKGNKALDHTGESLKKQAKEFGLELDFSEQEIKKHIEFKKKHGYHIPKDYYALLSKDSIKDLILKGVLDTTEYKTNKEEKKEAEVTSEEVPIKDNIDFKNKEKNNKSDNGNKTKPSENVKKENKKVDFVSNNKKEKKKVDYKGVFTAILAIIAYPFIKIWEGLKFIGRIFKRLILNIKGWFEDTFLFNRMLNKTIFGGKHKREKSKSSKYKKARKGLKLSLPKLKLPEINFSIDSRVFLFLIPIALATLSFLGYTFNWFNGEFFDNLNDSVKFVEGYGKWGQSVADWINSGFDSGNPFLFLLSLVAIFPVTIIVYVIEGIWWLISWIIIGIIKLLILLLGSIVLLLPYLLCGGGIALDVILYVKDDDKELMTTVGFILSLLVCVAFLAMIIF